MPSILALDQGTTSSRALVVHDSGTVLGRGRREFPQHYPEPGWVEHDPEDLFTSTIESAKTAIAEAGERPSGIGITNQRETLVLWDRASLAAVAPAIVWQDRRTAARCGELRAAGTESEVRARTGLLLDPYFTATKLEWLLRDAELRRRAEHGELAAGTVDSWLIARLTGGRAHVTDPTNASRTMLYALREGVWDRDLMTLFAIPEAVLPSIVPSSNVCAETDAAIFGVSLPIAGIAGDQQAALFGQGCADPGRAKNTYGTGAFLLLYTGETPPAPPEGLLATAACDRRGGRGFALEGSVFIAGAAIQWLRDGLGLLRQASESAALAASVPDTGGVSFVPAFVGLGSPHWEPEARGTITGITRGTTRAHLVRAALEAMAFGSDDLLDSMLAATGLSLPSLRVDGGAAENDWVMQFQADVLGVPVERSSNVETTALGAAALAGLALGTWPSLEAFMATTAQHRVFVPAMEAEQRARMRKGWRRAVSTALHWARSGGVT
ncbi:MAG TPA: glycerol kinase GlpK [Gemmatimonadales bacterium]|nr:glycerol kinase GlpK [Gemmatimonadales bacterium]